MERLRTDHVLRVGYHPDHIPYSYINARQKLVGFDVELMHRLAIRLNVRLEFVPYSYDSLVEQLDGGQIDVAVGGLMIQPERLLRMGFSASYESATVAVVVPDHRRGEFATWDPAGLPPNSTLGVVYEDLAAAARRQLPNVKIERIDSLESFFTGDHDDLDGLIIAAEEGAAWTVLYPEYTVVVPQPEVQRPVGMAVRESDTEWERLLDRWLEFGRLDGSLDQLRRYWIEGVGTEEQRPRWCVVRDVLHWLP